MKTPYMQLILTSFDNFSLMLEKEKMIAFIWLLKLILYIKLQYLLKTDFLLRSNHMKKDKKLVQVVWLFVKYVRPWPECEMKFLFWWQDKKNLKIKNLPCPLASSPDFTVHCVSAFCINQTYWEIERPAQPF